MSYRYKPLSGYRADLGGDAEQFKAVQTAWETISGH